MGTGDKGRINFPVQKYTVTANGMVFECNALCPENAARRITDYIDIGTGVTVRVRDGFAVDQEYSVYPVVEYAVVLNKGEENDD